VRPRDNSLSFNTDLIAAPSSPDAMPPRLAAARIRLPALKEDCSANPDGSEGFRPPCGPDDRSPCLLPIRFFPFQATTHACLKLWLILPEAGLKPSIFLPAIAGFGFLPHAGKPALLSDNKTAPRHPPLAFRAFGCGQDRPRQLIAIEAAMVVASNEKQRRMTMANIGTFTKAEDGTLSGFIKTLQLNTKARFVPLDATSEDAPDFRTFAAGNVEIGAAWKKTSQQGDRPYVSVKLDDPSLPAPIYASLYEDDEQPGQYSLIWTRRKPK
jgi:uncharacterized protein (DUF736 family)